MVDRAEPAEDVVRRLRAIAARLPEAHEEDAWTGIRWRIRQRTFAHVMVTDPAHPSAYTEATGLAGPVTVLTFRAAGDELLALVHAGLPFYKPDWSPTAMGMTLGEETDWTEVAELVTESYRLLASQRLSRLLD